MDADTLEEIKFNRIYTFAELYGTEKSPKEWAAEIIKARRQFGIGDTKRLCVDPSVLNRLSDGSRSIGDQMNDIFIEVAKSKTVMEGGSRNRKMRWATMDDWIRPAVDGMPYWMISSYCTNLIRTIPLMEPDDNDIEDINTKLEDHAVDDVSYFFPFIKWIDSKIGGVKRQIRRKSIPTHTSIINIDKFHNKNK